MVLKLSNKKNHFIEVGEDSKGVMFITIHSGSRNFGLKVCKYHSDIAKNQSVSDLTEYNEKRNEIINNSDKKDIQHKLAELKSSMSLGVSREYLKGENMFNYCVDALIAQYYAVLNRSTMLSIIASKCNLQINKDFSCTHNYIDFNGFVIRKGAISAKSGDCCLIPLNMRDGILFCEGKGNEDWNMSAPHGAGRILSRSAAKSTLSLDEFKTEMEGIYSSSVNEFTLDEAPMAYKDSEMIKNAILPTVKVLDIIKPCLNIKANE
ncbi:MAG: RtcB family protein [Bacteroidales bacterium]